MVPGAAERPIVDCHTHIFPDWRRQKLIGWAKRALPDHPVPVEADVETLVGMLEDAGTTSWANLLFPIRADEASELHRFNAELAASYAGCVPVGGVHAEDADPVGVVREGVEDHGMVGIKLHPLVQRFSPVDPRLDGVFAYLEEIQGVVYIHTGFERWYRQDRQFADVAEIVRRYPGITFVLPHVAYPRIEDAVALAAQNDNVWLDLTNLPTTASPRPPRGVAEMVDGDGGWVDLRDQIRGLVAAVGPRIVYGTDHPAGLDAPVQLLEDLLGLGLSPVAVDRILRRNPARLISHAVGVPARGRAASIPPQEERMG